MKTTILTAVAILAISFSLTTAPAAIAANMSPAQRATVFAKCMASLDMRKAPDGIRAGTPERTEVVKAGADYGILPKWRKRGKKKKMIGVGVWVANSWNGDPDVRACLRTANLMK